MHCLYISLVIVDKRGTIRARDHRIPNILRLIYGSEIWRELCSHFGTSSRPRPFFPEKSIHKHVQILHFTKARFLKKTRYFSIMMYIFLMLVYLKEKNNIYGYCRALQHNQIKEIQPDAFLPLVGLEDM